MANNINIPILTWKDDENNGNIRCHAIEWLARRPVSDADGNTGWQSRTLHLHALPAGTAQDVRISGIAKKSRNLSLQDPHSSTRGSVGFVASSPFPAPFQQRTSPTVSEREGEGLD
ncbi:hypothetical protein K3495_g1759 [Podosphaera aphanis]|nr:hypothetical protein K3495_g1759 [Podosphaera aphanis]